VKVAAVVEEEVTGPEEIRRNRQRSGHDFTQLLKA
jgi:hypothetical protein